MKFSPKKHLTRRSALSLLISLPAALAAPLAAQAQVTFFEKPPTADQLRAALRGGGAAPARQAVAPRPAGVRTRGIVWDKPAAGVPANNVAQQPTPAAVTANAPITPGPAAGMPINFARGSAKLDASSIRFVQTVAEVLRSDPGVSLIIEGHTDATGGYQRNMVLSWERAMGVYRALVENFGIEPSRLQPVGKGPSEPMPGTAPTDGSNRRVQFRLNG